MQVLLGVGRRIFGRLAEDARLDQGVAFALVGNDFAHTLWLVSAGLVVFVLGSELLVVLNFAAHVHALVVLQLVAANLNRVVLLLPVVGLSARRERRLDVVGGA